MLPWLCNNIKYYIHHNKASLKIYLSLQCYGVSRIADRPHGIFWTLAWLNITHGCRIDGSGYRVVYEIHYTKPLHPLYTWRLSQILLHDCTNKNSSKIYYLYFLQNCFRHKDFALQNPLDMFHLVYFIHFRMFSDHCFDISVFSWKPYKGNVSKSFHFEIARYCAHVTVLTHKITLVCFLLSLILNILSPYNTKILPCSKFYVFNKIKLFLASIADTILLLDPSFQSHRTCQNYTSLLSICL